MNVSIQRPTNMSNLRDVRWVSSWAATVPPVAFSRPAEMMAPAHCTQLVVASRPANGSMPVACCSHAPMPATSPEPSIHISTPFIATSSGRMV